jgi:glycosyltransferase involved in cell wall biosynthesis
MENLSQMKFIYIACPWTPLGGGMFKVADYLIQHQEKNLNHANAAILKPLDTRGELHPFFSLFYVTLAIIKILWFGFQNKLVGVHVNMAERLSLFRKMSIIWSCKLVGVPVILHLHAAQLHHFYAKLPKPLQDLTRWTFSLADEVIVLGDTARQFVIQTLGVDSTKIVSVINGVPSAKYTKNHHRNGFNLLFLGNLSERKGVSDILHALSKSTTIKKIDDFSMRFVGSGDISYYQNLAQSLGVDQYVAFLGWADQDKAAKLMSESDALILPSYDEGLPLVILEALANEIAVIATPVGEIPHHFTHLENAFLVKPGDINAITNAIECLIQDEPLRLHIAKAGLDAFNRLYSIDSFSDQIAHEHLNVFGYTARNLTSSEKQS